MDMPVYLTKEGILIEMKENLSYLNECNLEFWKADNPTRKKECARNLINELNYLKDLGIKHSFIPKGFFKYIKDHTDKSYVIKTFGEFALESKKLKEKNDEVSRELYFDIIVSQIPALLYLMVPSDKFYDFYSNHEKRFTFYNGILSDNMMFGLHYYLMRMYNVE